MEDASVKLDLFGERVRKLWTDYYVQLQRDIRTAISSEFVNTGDYSSTYADLVHEKYNDLIVMQEHYCTAYSRYLKIKRSKISWIFAPLYYKYLNYYYYRVLFPEQVSFYMLLAQDNTEFLAELLMSGRNQVKKLFDLVHEFMN